MSGEVNRGPKARKGLSVTGLIRDDAGRVLLVKQTYGHLNWELPGGSVEAGELVIDAVIREVREETGLQVVVDRLAGIYDEQDIDFLHLVFVCRQSVPGAEPRADLSEVSRCGFWPVDALPRPISDYTIRRIQDAIVGTSPQIPSVIRERNWLE